MPSAAASVDDSRAVRMILSRTLRELGFEVGEAGNGLEALGVLNADRQAFSLILADWNMPEMNGFDLLREVRKDPALNTTKVVMVSTETELGHMSAALQAGANEYVMKPFTRDILVQKLQLAGVRV